MADVKEEARDLFVEGDHRGCDACVVYMATPHLCMGRVNSPLVQEVMLDENGEERFHALKPEQEMQLSPDNPLGRMFGYRYCPPCFTVLYNHYKSRNKYFDGAMSFDRRLLLPGLSI